MLHLTFDRISKKVNRQSSIVNRYPWGFTIIELLIVVSILGVIATVVTTSFLSFEKRERVKSAALILKNQIRAAQNKALSGDKGYEVGNLCLTTSNLVGWYVNVVEGSGDFSIAGDCQTGALETTFGQTVIKLPKDVTIAGIVYNPDLPQSKNSANILFRPSENEVRFFETTAPPFLSGAQLDNAKLFDSSLLQNSIKITLQVVGSSTYEVIVLPSGSVYERKL